MNQKGNAGLDPFEGLPDLPPGIRRAALARRLQTGPLAFNPSEAVARATLNPDQCAPIRPRIIRSIPGHSAPPQPGLRRSQAHPPERLEQGGKATKMTKHDHTQFLVTLEDDQPLPR